MRKYFLALAACLIVQLTFGQTVIFSNTITGTNPSAMNPYTLGQVVQPGLAASGIGRGPGITASSANDRYSAGGWSTTVLDATDYFEWTLTPEPGFEIHLAGFSYTGQRSASGPQLFALRSSVDGFTSDIGVATTTGVVIDLSGTTFQQLTSAVTFRFYGWGATAGTGTFSINDFNFTGDLVPISSGPAIPLLNGPVVTNITATTAQLGGTIASDGGAAIVSRGVVWSATDADPQIGAPAVQTLIEGGNAIGTFNVAATGLPHSSTVYFKAFATNGIGTAYSQVIAFNTLSPEPSEHLAALACGIATSSTLQLNWTEPAGPVLPAGYLIKWSSNGFADIQPPVDGIPETGSNVQHVVAGNQSAVVPGLAAGSFYYFRIYPYTNSGAAIDYKTGGLVPEAACQTLAGAWESFESGSKGNYAAADEQLQSGSWRLDDALLGSGASDRKNGLQSARIRNGFIAMNFDLTGGMGTLSLSHAAYGTDGPSDWMLQASTNGGASWDAYVSPVITTTSNQLTTQSFVLNLGGNVRVRVIKMDAAGNRLNIDDISYTSFNNAPLPVQFSAFKAVQRPDGIEISWTNETEASIDRYLVEHSHNGAAFKTIAQQSPQKNDGSAASYRHLHATPFTGPNFYRVTAIEYGGQKNHTAVVKIIAPIVSPDVQIYPNPVKSTSFQLALKDLRKGRYHVSIWNSSGMAVAQQQIRHEGGPLSCSIYTGVLPPGIYQLRLQGSGVKSIQFLVE